MMNENIVETMASDLGETPEAFKEQAVSERVERIIESYVENHIEKLCQELESRGYDVVETLPKFQDFTPVFTAIVEGREEDITKAIEYGIA